MRVIVRSFNRHGGLSRPPFASRNLSFGVGDRPEAVAGNRRLLKEELGIAVLASARQVHGERLWLIAEPLAHDREAEGFDGLITDQPGLGLMIQQADCQAVMLFDPRREVIANLHVGWRGSVANILARAIAVMTSAFATDPVDLRAWISPSLGPCCAEFVHYRQELPPRFHSYQPRPNHFDFWAISRDQLLAAGLREGNIATAGVCTCCSPAYFSYRREKHTGRAASVIAMQEGS